jgi:hypothetical protein
MDENDILDDSMIPISLQLPLLFPAGLPNIATTPANNQVSYVQLPCAAGPLSAQFRSHSAFGGTADPMQHSDLAIAAGNVPMACKSGIVVTLDNAELWNEFNKLGTEMVITKSGRFEPGTSCIRGSNYFFVSRRMFPCLGFKVSGLEAHSLYTLVVTVCPVDNFRHKYINNRWIAVGKVDKSPPPSREHIHPDSPKSGNFWCKQPIIFKRLKLTNNRKGHHTHVRIGSGHSASVHSDRSAFF